MSELGEQGESKAALPKISQKPCGDDWRHPLTRQLLHERFRKLGLIDYNGRIYVHNSLLNVVMNDQLPDDDVPAKPPIPAFARRQRMIGRQERLPCPKLAE